ncbi:hypothetical protein PGN35_028405 [Nodosilinea sp. PGN35]|uniref:hypothetical protein n=1 Tax=Nodosilinea sp. PGN35 TaxID=3020489 RepID=UPI0023B2872F|nr:hypothetical protein [Nodosilinea sp. TSF1-S3]MDF0365361.1 hypothetical protein [Nodosilinea sp. TSF1-S3]
MAFITLLATAVGIVSAIALLVVGLVEAPWQLLLIGLLVALYGLQRQIWANESALQNSSAVVAPRLAQENKAAPSSPAQTDSRSSVTAKPAEPEGVELIYRGIRYRVSQPTPEPLQAPHD